jgi:hypothetical protein
MHVLIFLLCRRQHPSGNQNQLDAAMASSNQGSSSEAALRERVMQSHFISVRCIYLGEQRKMRCRSCVWCGGAVRDGFANEVARDGDGACS